MEITEEELQEIYDACTTKFMEQVEEGRKKCSMYEIYDGHCRKCDGIVCPYDLDYYFS